MSRGIRFTALTVAALLVMAPAGPASADDAYDVPDDATVTITGDGSGHGRGMSQYGAYSAARKGVGYGAILKTYYPKTRWKQAKGSIEVAVTRDDDNNLVVGHHRRLTVRSLRSGRTWHADARRATRWRVTRKPTGVNQVAYFNGRWRAWKTVRGNVQLAAGGRPLTLFTPRGKVRYRGSLRSAVDDSGDRVTVNVLPLEQYLRGVVPSEMRASTWPQHALRAQAVASRTYAAWRRNRPLDRAYDICDTALCQVYGGASAEYSTSDKAVWATAREILTFRRKPAFTEYSASNGGHTVSGGKPYLPAKKDPYEGTSADYYGWTVQVTSQQMEAEYDYDDLASIAIEERDGLGPRGGRVLQVRVTAESGFTDTITGEDFRRDWGLPSTLFTITQVR
ncbi:SpoIID/LytB domain-containing protein [Nocardioides sp.]|uniref:SpoIID/LytB domain-containing protein n=1 Tax=Nocardioides sp. TaxID=35761 RepID=UPI002ED3042C